MLKLHGFSSSNYYNLVKLLLMEKGLAFEEVPEFPGESDTLKDRSPRGKYPYLETPSGFVSESLVIADYLEDSGEGLAMLPSDAFQRSKLRHLAKTNELYLELVVRRLLPAFFGGNVSDETKMQVSADLALGIESLKRQLDIGDFVNSDRFSLADASSIMHWPMVQLVAKSVLGQNPFEGIDGLEDYLSRMEARKTVQEIRIAQNENMPKFMAHIKSLMSALNA